MPKGDRLILKADPEDGTTPIANLLLDAVAIAKISGLQKGAILHLWRQTYGWIDDNGKRRKECKITLREWMEALDSSKSRTSEALSELELKGIMIRRMANAWGGYYYKINTLVSKWNSNSINFEKLSKITGIPINGTVAQNGTVLDSDNSSDNDNSSNKDNSTDFRNGTVAQNGTEQLPKTEQHTLYKETLNKDKEKGVDKIPDNNKIGEVIVGLDKLRGYKTTKRTAEAGAIKRMLKNYNPEQILKTWSDLKAKPFWVNQELFMMSVESQIGAIVHGTHISSNQNNEKPTNDPDKYIKGKYGHIVQR